MPTFTTPPIYEAQNTESSLRLLAAQRQTYADAKLLHFAKLSIVLIGGLATVATTFMLDPFKPIIGAASGVTLLILSLAGSAREKKKVDSAAAMQEEFDTSVFQLPWARGGKVRRPSASEVARASMRYKRGNLRDWYGITTRIARPADVLICQRVNLGWGAATHRAWAACAFSLGILLLSAVTVAAILGSLSLLAAIIGVYVPLIPAIKELIEVWRSNSRSAQLKEEADHSAGEMWESVVRKKKLPSEAQCRKLQDDILAGRRKNALIPDWFYRALRSREEAVMRLSVGDYLEQGRQQGFCEE
ncbi:S-4TM family putative pore-forming effector [Streptomyces sp. NPDC058794]|uniref:S-4TM family putative pore-forming effector n=1 Tax=Streptomyces TaxID=1883 RepID=UPI00106EDB68|nr:S-4TM family putative pore-forming effector [Streptomyces sp. H23]